MESAFLRMWDIPRSLIFLVHVLWCYPGSLVYISPTLSLLVPGLLSLPLLLRLSPLHSFNFDVKVPIFWQFFSYFNWSVLFNRDGHINEQAAFFPVCSWLQCLVCWLYLTTCLHWHIPQDYDVVFFCYCLGLILVPFLVFAYIWLYSSLLMQLATWIMFPIFANVRISGHISK